MGSKFRPHEVAPLEFEGEPVGGLVLDPLLLVTLRLRERHSIRRQIQIYMSIAKLVHESGHVISELFKIVCLL